MMVYATNFHCPSPLFFRPHLHWLLSLTPDAAHFAASEDSLGCRLAATRITRRGDSQGISTNLRSVKIATFG